MVGFYESNVEPMGSITSFLAHLKTLYCRIFLIMLKVGGIEFGAAVSHEPVMPAQDDGCVWNTGKEN